MTVLCIFPVGLFRAKPKCCAWLCDLNKPRKNDHKGKGYSKGKYGKGKGKYGKGKYRGKGKGKYGKGKGKNGKNRRKGKGKGKGKGTPVLLEHPKRY